MRKLVVAIVLVLCAARVLAESPKTKLDGSIKTALPFYLGLPMPGVTRQPAGCLLGLQDGQGSVWPVWLYYVPGGPSCPLVGARVHLEAVLSQAHCVEDYCVTDELVLLATSVSVR
jgi:hypothetical protein